MSLAGYVFSAHGPARFVFHTESHTVTVYGDFLAVGILAVFPGPSESTDAQVLYGREPKSADEVFVVITVSVVHPLPIVHS